MTLNVWEAVYFDHDADRLIDLAERAAAVGVERYVLDDGWFGARRDDRAGSATGWSRRTSGRTGCTRWSTGSAKLGMQFGLWFEPEMVNPDSDLARAHPEWIMAARAEWPVESRHQQVLNLGVPAAYEHVKGQMLAVLDEYDIDYIKWDHNRDLIEAGNQPDGGRPGVHDQTLAFYRLLDELRAAHPALEIESCSSGGARVDLGVLERTDRVWVSDNIDPHDRQPMMRWTAQLVPAGVPRLAHRVGPLAHDRPPARPGVPGRDRDLRPPRHRVGPGRGLRRRARRARRVGRVLQGAPRRCCSAATWCGWTASTTTCSCTAWSRPTGPGRSSPWPSWAAPTPSPGPRLRFRGLDRGRALPGATRRGRDPARGLQPPRWWGAGPDFPGGVFTGATLAEVGVAAPIVFPDQVVLLHAVRE